MGAVRPETAPVLGKLDDERRRRLSRRNSYRGWISDYNGGQNLRQPPLSVRPLMSDDRKNLGETLALLRAQLAAAEVSGELEPQVAARLRATAGELEDALEGDRTDAGGESPRSDYLTEAVAHFEQSHPTLAGTVQQLIDLLAQMGI